jgi:hypothetical protein
VVVAVADREVQVAATSHMPDGVGPVVGATHCCDMNSPFLLEAISKPNLTILKTSEMVDLMGMTLLTTYIRQVKQDRMVFPSRSMGHVKQVIQLAVLGTMYCSSLLARKVVYP